MQSSMTVPFKTALHVVSIFLTIVNGGPTGQYLTVTPEHLTVSEGQPGRLKCSVGNRVGKCQWTKDGFALGTERDLPQFARYRMDGSSDDICDLIIDPVLPVDEGQYQCQVSGLNGKGSITSEIVKLDVNCEPGTPYIVQAKEGEKVEVEEGEEVELHCQSQGGRPPAEIQWWDQDGNRLVQEGNRLSIQEFATKIQDKKTWLTISILKIVPNKPLVLKCTVFNDAFPTPKESEPIQVTIKGQLTAEIKRFNENDTFKLKCRDDKMSGEHKYKWIINDNEITEESANTLKIVQINDSYDNSMIKCFLILENGTEEVQKVFHLSYKSTKIQVPQSEIGSNNLKKDFKRRKSKKKRKEVANNMKNKTVFTCVAEEESASEPKYVWIDGSLEKSVTAHSEEKQKYKCKVIDGGYSKITQMAHNMRGITKKIKRFSKTLNHITNLIDVT